MGLKLKSTGHRTCDAGRAARRLLALAVLFIAIFDSRAVFATSDATAATAATVTSPTATPPRRAPLIVVTTLGHVQTQRARLACRSLLETLPVRCEIRGKEAAGNFQGSWDKGRGQLDARAILESMFKRRAVDAHVELLITDFDLYEGERPYVFGLGSLTDRVAVISTARITGNPRRLEQRLIKLVQHEIGHTMGLPHHDERGCVMRTDATVASLDSAPTVLCDTCHVTLNRTARLLSRRGQTALDHARGHLVRGQIEEARAEANGAIEGADASLLIELGNSFLRAGVSEDAILVLRLALRKTPNSAGAHLSLGIALQHRDQRNDLELAIGHYERALALRPQWSQVHTHLTQLRANLARAQGPS